MLKDVDMKPFKRFVFAVFSVSVIKWRNDEILSFCNICIFTQAYFDFRLFQNCQKLKKLVQNRILERFSVVGNGKLCDILSIMCL